MRREEGKEESLINRLLSMKVYPCFFFPPFSSDAAREQRKVFSTAKHAKAPKESLSGAVINGVI